jgi:F0F1-type ATP synthase membrane subunit c/vacuolar-type H+-ATPase subunit K
VHPVSPLATARLVWGALLNGVVLYGFVLWVIDSRPAPPAVDPGDSPLGGILWLAGATSGVTAWVVFRRSFPAARGQQAFTRYVLVWALCETVGLYGLVLGILTRDLGEALPFLVAAAGLLLAFRPRLEHLAG